MWRLGTGENGNYQPLPHRHQFLRKKDLRPSLTVHSLYKGAIEFFQAL